MPSDKYYLGGLHFTVRTPHAVLQWLMSFRELEGQLARWIEEIEVYDFTVIHRPRVRHGTSAGIASRMDVATVKKVAGKRVVANS